MNSNILAMLRNKQRFSLPIWHLFALILFLGTFSSTEMFASNEDLKTTIMLINGEAVLVDLNTKGDILKKYINVPEYFKSWQSHETLVKRSLKKVDTRDIGYKSFDIDHHELSSKKIKEIITKENTQKDWCDSSPSQLQLETMSSSGSTAIPFSYDFDFHDHVLDWPIRQKLYRREVS